MNFLAGGSRYFAPADSNLDEWTQDPHPFVDGGPFGDAGSQSFVPLPKLVEGTTLPPGGPVRLKEISFLPFILFCSLENNQDFYAQTCLLNRTI